MKITLVKEMGGYYRMSSKHQFPKTGLLSRLFSFLQRLFLRDTSEKESPTKRLSDTGANVHERIMAMLRSEEGVRFH